MSEINNLRPFPNTSGWDSTQESGRPPANILDAATNTLAGKLDTLRTRHSAACAALDALTTPAAKAAAEQADLRAAASAAAAGTTIPGHVAADQRKADIAAKEFEIEALAVARDEAISALNVKRSALDAAGSADTNAAAVELQTAINTLATKFTAYATLEARDSWFKGNPYIVRTNVVNQGLLPGLYSGTNTNGMDNTPAAVVIDQLAVALGPGA